MGYRRWALNPKMGNTDFGFVGNFSAMLALDDNLPENLKTNIAWTTQNMPIIFFLTGYPSSLSIGNYITNQVKATISNRKTKEITKFEEYENYKFVVNHENCGSNNCIIFSSNFFILKVFLMELMLIVLIFQFNMI